MAEAWITRGVLIMKLATAALLLWVKDACRYAGLVLILIGGTCIPIPPTSPKQLTTIFPWLAMSGSLVEIGLITMGAGALLIAVSLVWRNREL